MSDVFAQCSDRGAIRFVFAGVSELAEIGSLRAQDYELDLIGTYDPDSKLDRFLNKPVWHDFESVLSFDTCIFTALMNTDVLYRELSERLETGQWMIPDILEGVIRRDA